MAGYKYVILFTMILAQFVIERSPIVKLDQGLVRGVLSEDGEAYEYFGIPYASVSESNRFQGPGPPPYWQGILNTVEETVRCKQRIWSYPRYNGVMGQTDCLKLNVYTPVRRQSDELLPVMVYIHGGAFFEGSGLPALYGPDRLMRHGIVFVGINYRLFAEGFLCLRIREAPGNAGLKDQIAALRWVQRNIKAFGGDPKKVTLFGESAGGISSSILMLSPQSKGLFRNLIIQSGSSLSPSAIQRDPIAHARKLAAMLGFETSDPYELYNIFRNHTPDDLLLAQVPRPKGKTIFSDLLFFPCIEKEIPGIDPVITNHPNEILSSGKYVQVPVISGFNSLETYLFLMFEEEFKADMTVYNILPEDLDFKTETNKKTVANTLQKQYFDGKNISERPSNELGNYCSDVFFIYPAIAEAELIARRSTQPIYNYIFQYSSWMSIPKLLSGFAGTRGAVHADDVMHLFKLRIAPIMPTAVEHIMIEQLTRMWTNFAKYGNPTPPFSNPLQISWEPSEPDELKFLLLDSQVKMGTYENKETIRLLNNTYAKYRRRNWVG